ncbi:MAG: hypothetical protein SV253_06645 [Halobacteria archaeon]|nr:hypothetical protein [Halobacteria archaeon]
MTVSGVCYICGDEAVATCRACGGAVCDEHYDTETGLCVRCLSGMQMD